MTDIQFSAPLTRPSTETAPNATLGYSIAAMALAFLIGLSAVDIQRPPVSSPDTWPSWQQDGSILDGRGKWGGYLER